jgi:predicted Na+-dependent transporter
MMSAGLSLSLQNVRERFKSTRFMVAALTANFVLVPLAAYLITRVFRLEPSLAIALLLLGTASGSPMLPKLVEFARGSLALTVGLMALLMTGTIVTMPLILPVLLPGAHANAWSIAKPLLGVVLPSLATGLILRVYRKTFAERIQPIFRVASNMALAAVLLVALASNFSNVDKSGNLSIILAGAAFSFIAFGIGFALGGPETETRKVLALGTAQRSASIAFLVAIENFRGPNVVNALAILALVSLVIQVPAALALGTRTRQSAKMDQKIH